MVASLPREGRPLPLAASPHRGSETGEETRRCLKAPPLLPDYRSVEPSATRRSGQLAWDLASSVMTDPHARRVSHLAALLAREMGLAEGTVRRCATAGLYHDLGKALLPAELIEKPGPLSAEEWERVRRHPELGADLLGRLAPELSELADIIRDHHERPDGQGYPAGKRADEIRIEARILAVCDAWAAMRSHRPYRRALTIDRAVAELRRGRGRQLDALVVDVFLRLAQRLQAEGRDALGAAARWRPASAPARQGGEGWPGQEPGAPARASPSPF